MDGRSEDEFWALPDVTVLAVWAGLVPRGLRPQGPPAVFTPPRRAAGPAGGAEPPFEPAYRVVPDVEWAPEGRRGVGPSD